MQHTDWFCLTMTEHWLIIRQYPKLQVFLNICLILLSDLIDESTDKNFYNYRKKSSRY